MRYIKVQDKVFNFEQVSEFYVQYAGVVIVSHGCATTIQYTTTTDAETAVNQIIEKLMYISNSYAGEVK